jgi:1,4-dihydroxy-2-naphthoate octaprenyltransferase
MKLFFKAVRAPFFTATIVPIVIGAVSAARVGHVNLILFALCLIGGLSFHGSANVLNDYYDYRGGTDNINRYHNIFSGGSRMIQDGLMTPRQTFALGAGLLGLGVAIGLYLVYRAGIVVLFFGLAGTILVLIYSIPRWGLAYIGHGLGELAVALGFGPVMVLGTYYVLTGTLATSAWFLSIVPALLIALILFVNGYPDFDADLATRKHTAVVSLGRSAARYAYALILLATYLSVIVGVATGIIPSLSLVSLLTIPVSVAAVKKLFEVYDDPRGVVAVCGMTVVIHLFTGLLLALGVGISALVG